MTALGSYLDRAWSSLASVKLTLVILLGLLVLSIPGTIVLQFNISNVDPGIQYNYDFWKFGSLTQLFTAYHSFWYVALIAILAMNLIACSIERWPQMLKLAMARPVTWSASTFHRQPDGLHYAWKTKASADSAKMHVLKGLRKAWLKPVVLEQGENHFQIFWQVGRWSRISNYLVHTSLLVVFAGAIISALYGFEGAANIPEGSAVDTFIVFNEGKGSGLERAPGGLVNERLLGFRLGAEQFAVKFYDDFPGRPKEFMSVLNVLENGKSMKRGEIRVNYPMKYRNFTFYQASYGSLGDFGVQARVIDKSNPREKQSPIRGVLGEVQKPQGFDLELVPVQAFLNVQNLGPAVQFQEVKNGKPSGAPYWVLKNYPRFDIERRESRYGVILEDLEELYFTGLQISHDPGAPVYWLGCLGMLIGTFYALFVTHRKFYLRYDKGAVEFAGTIHRLPIGFQQNVALWAQRLKTMTGES